MKHIRLVPLVLAAATSFLLAPKALGLATEHIGPDTKGNLTVAQPGWFKGIVDPLKHPSRVYSRWVNGGENFYFKATPDDINELIDLFSKARLRDHDIWIKPGTNTVQMLTGNRSFECNVSLQILDGIALYASRERDNVETLEPSLTIYVGEDASLLKQLKLPDNVILHCEIKGADFKRKLSKPVRQAWYGSVQFDDGTSVPDLVNSVSTRITLWDGDSPDGIPLTTVSRDGYFKAVFSDGEVADLKSGKLWLTATTGNFLAEPKRTDSRILAALLVLDKATATPSKISRPQNYYYGRVLFEDGAAPMLNPKPWPSAEISVDFPYAGRATLDAEGYFRVFLEPEQFRKLKEERPRKNIYMPLSEQGRSSADAEFPPALLSQDKAKAGVVKIAKPSYSK